MQTSVAVHPARPRKFPRIGIRHASTAKPVSFSDFRSEPFWVGFTFEVISTLHVSPHNLIGEGVAIGLQELLGHKDIFTTIVYQFGRSRLIDQIFQPSETVIDVKIHAFKDVNYV